jgi:hypothetical protein
MNLNQFLKNVFAGAILLIGLYFASLVLHPATLAFVFIAIALCIFMS